MCFLALRSEHVTIHAPSTSLAFVDECVWVESHKTKEIAMVEAHANLCCFKYVRLKLNSVWVKGAHACIDFMVKGAHAQDAGCLMLHDEFQRL